MKTILKIFKNDLIGIKKSILTIVLAVGLCILPALYAWFNIFANWDPYANTGNINIAVVNLDKGYTDADGNEMNMGQSVVDKLKSQTSIGWVFPESEKSAIGGVKSGTYYAAVVIDEDFPIETAHLAVVALGIELGVLDVAVNELHNFLQGLQVLGHVGDLRVGDTPPAGDRLELVLKGQL